MPSQYRNNVIYLLVATLVFLSAFFKIADLDFWWHLKTGQVIVEQKAFQYQEIYSFTAAGREYIDHEWLFQATEFLTYSFLGVAGIIFLKCAVLVLMYLLITRFLLHQPLHSLITLIVLIVSIAGARTRFIERPEIFTSLFLVCTYMLLDQFVRTPTRKVFWILPLIVVWCNFHAAVILGIVLQCVFIGASVLIRLLGNRLQTSDVPMTNQQIRTLIVLLLSSLALTGANPYGYRVLKVPFELTSIIDSGLLHNQEWQHPTPQHLPFYYICLIVTFGITLVNFRNLNLRTFILSVFFAYISLKYLRNVGLFCVMMPFFVAPYLANFAPAKTGLWIAAIVCLFIISVYTLPYSFGIGIASYFPEKIVRFTQDKNLQGNMINSYGFGGYLIWRLYPERKIFIDGRNEVYLPLLQKLIQMREDSRSWTSLLNEYDIEYALLNYVDELERVTVLDKNMQKSITYAPFSSTHFPRAKWALVYWDDNGMVYIKRNGVNANIVAMEYKNTFPEGTNYEATLARTKKIDITEARRELVRKLREEPGCTRASAMLRQIEGLQ